MTLANEWTGHADIRKHVQRKAVQRVLPLPWGCVDRSHHDIDHRDFARGHLRRGLTCPWNISVRWCVAGWAWAVLRRGDSSSLMKRDLLCVVRRYFWVLLIAEGKGQEAARSWLFLGRRQALRHREGGWTWHLDEIENAAGTSFFWFGGRRCDSIGRQRSRRRSMD